MILSYKQKFPWGAPTNFDQKIIYGPKRHSIRDDIHNRWKPGMIIHHAYGVRTPDYRCFAKGQCFHIHKIEIKIIDNVDSIFSYCYMASKETNIPTLFSVYIDDRPLTYKQIEWLAENDGFSSTADFFRWFKEPGVKKIIHFTDFKY